MPEAAMHISNIPAPAATATPMREQGVAKPLGGAEGFDLELAGAVRQDRNAELREAAEQLVSQALLMPLMKLMRDEPFKTDMFHGGMGEDMFAQQLDQHLTESMAGRAGGSIVDAVYDRFSQGPGGQSRGMKVDDHG